MRAYSLNVKYSKVLNIRLVPVYALVVSVILAMILLGQLAATKEQLELTQEQLVLTKRAWVGRGDMIPEGAQTEGCGFYSQERIDEIAAGRQNYNATNCGRIVTSFFKITYKNYGLLLANNAQIRTFESLDRLPTLSDVDKRKAGPPFLLMPGEEAPQRFSINRSITDQLGDGHRIYYMFKVDYQYSDVSGFYWVIMELKMETPMPRFSVIDSGAG